jgi:hypothetical protein
MRPKVALQTPRPAGTSPDETLKAFVAKNRLKLRKDIDETSIVLGRTGQIYEHSDGVLGVMFMPASAKTADKWCNRRRAGVAAGMTVHQDGDREGTLHFSGANKAGGKLAIQIAGCKKKRFLSATQRELLTRRLRNVRETGSGRTGGPTSVRQRVDGPEGRGTYLSSISGELQPPTRPPCVGVVDGLLQRAHRHQQDRTI